MDAQEPALAPAQLAQLRSLDPLGETGLLCRLLEAFERSLQRQGEAAEQALVEGSPAALSDAAHGLKSAAAYVGAMALSRACRELELATQVGLGSGLQESLADFWREHQRALGAVRACLEAAD
jgi:HPt (histidine-containing phosphotransfer) domain-containing protein